MNLFLDMAVEKNTAVHGNCDLHILECQGIAEALDRLEYPSPSSVRPLPPRTFFSPCSRIKFFCCVRISLKVHFIQLHQLCTLQCFPPQIHYQHYGQFNIETDKGDSVKGRAKAAPTLYQNEE